MLRSGKTLSADKVLVLRISRIRSATATVYGRGAWQTGVPPAIYHFISCYAAILGSQPFSNVKMAPSRQA